MNLGYRSHCPPLVLFVLVISLDIFFLHLYCRFLRRILQRLINGGVEQMYTEMASRHRVRFPCIQIIKTATNQLNFARGRALSSSITPKSSSLWFSRKFDHPIGSSIPHIRHQGRTYLCNSC